MDMDAFLQSFSEDFVQEENRVGIQENDSNPLLVSPNQVTFKYKLEGMEYETTLPSPSSAYQLPLDTTLVSKTSNNNVSSSATVESFYPGELTPPVSLHSSPLQEAEIGVWAFTQTQIKQTNNK